MPTSSWSRRRSRRSPPPSRGCSQPRPGAIVTDVGSVKMPLVAAVGALAATADLPRYVPGHPMGGSERSGPDHASASVVDGIVWVVTPTTVSDPGAVDAARRLGRTDRRQARADGSRSSRPSRRVRQPPSPGRLDGADEPRGHRGGRRTRDPAPGRRGVPRPHAARRLQPCPVERHPPVQPCGDRGGARPLRRSAAGAAGGHRGGARRRRRGHLRPGEGRAAPARHQATGARRCGRAAGRTSRPPRSAGRTHRGARAKARSTSRTCRSCTLRKVVEARCTSPWRRRQRRRPARC